MGEPRASQGLIGRAVTGTVGAARRRVESEVGQTAQSVVDDLEPHLAQETIPRLLAAIEPHLAEETVPRLVDLLMPHLVETVVPAVVDGLAEHLATHTVPEVLELATPVLADDVLPDLLERLRPHLEAELVPAIVDALTPHLVQVTGPQLVTGLMPVIQTQVVPAVLEGVADDPRIRALVREQSWGLLTDAVERLRRLLALGDDTVERVVRAVLRRRSPALDAVPDVELPAGRSRSHAGIVSRAVGGGLDAAVVGWLAAQGLAAGFAVVGTLLGSVPTWLGVTMSGLAYLLLPTYLALCWRTAGTSLGGVVAGYSVTGLDGGLLGTGRAAVRALLGVPLAAVWAVGLLLGVVDPARRGLLDRVVGSRAPYRVGRATAPAPAAAVPSVTTLPPAPRTTVESPGAVAGSAAG
jgi:hypothetical protein